MKVVGIDGCKGGWISVWMDDEGNQGFDIISRIECIENMNAQMVMIDMPIGLPSTTDYRVCDQKARELLGASRSRVFLGARRPLLDFLPFERTNWKEKYVEINLSLKTEENGKGISQQLFWILDKIQEIDEFMTVERQRIIHESHPELVFYRLNNDKPINEGKKKSKGKMIRRKFLIKEGFRELDYWLDELPRDKAKPDDLFDACACALAASDALKGKKQKVGSETDTDNKGLRMEIWY